MKSPFGLRDRRLARYLAAVDPAHVDELVDVARAENVADDVTFVRYDRETVESVAVSARVLDHVRPTWYDELDTERLRLNDPRRCVLGQLFGDYERGLAALHDRLSSRPLLPLAEHVRRGTDCFVSVAAWRDEVARRRVADLEALPS